MNHKDLKKEDFAVAANSRGYQIKYKGHNIGGAGISDDARCPLGAAVRKQVEDYFREGNLDIDAILEGRGRRDYFEEIEKIITE